MVHPYYRVKPNSRLCTITGVIFLKIVTDQKGMHHNRVYKNDSNISVILFNSSTTKQNIKINLLIKH
jgi:hypothetical protein